MERMTTRYRSRREILKFRPLADENISEFQMMVLALYQEDPTGEQMSLQKIQKTIRELSTHPGKGTITLFHVGHIVVGYAIVIYDWSNEYGGVIAFIDEFYVKPPWRNRGIGSSYLKHIATAKGMSLKGIHVETTPENHKALDFYLKHGFKQDKNHHLFRKIR